MSIKHQFQSAKPDGSDATKVQATAWNADHDLSGLVASDVTDFNEAVDDRAAVLIQNGTGITWSYNDVAGTLTPTVTITQYTDEQAQDATASMIQNGTGITWSYNDGANTLTPTVTITQYTDEMAQDAVGTILTDTATIDFTYDDVGNKITADVKAGSIGSTELASTAVTPGSYTNTNLTVDADGRITAASNGSAAVIGSDTQIAYNNAGTMAGDSLLTWDNIASALTVGTSIRIVGNEIGGKSSTTPSGITFTAGSNTDLTASASGADLTMQSGKGSEPTTNGVNGGNSGFVSIRGTNGGTPQGATDANGGNGGDVFAFGGQGGAPVGAGSYGNSGSFQAGGGDAQGAANAGFIYLLTGYSVNGAAGDCTIELGQASGSGTNGNLFILNLPTSDPGISGAVWNNSNVLQISP